MNRRIAAEQQMNTGKCNGSTEVYSRVCGFYRPVKQWNKGKKEEFSQRLPYKVDK